MIRSTAFAPLAILAALATAPQTARAEAGNVVLFESWLRHEVPPNPVDAERISISFNYNWF